MLRCGVEQEGQAQRDQQKAHPIDLGLHDAHHPVERIEGETGGQRSGQVGSAAGETPGGSVRPGMGVMLAYRFGVGFQDLPPLVPGTLLAVVGHGPFMEGNG